ncbi:hypothetical protein D9M70_302810 [compost metagenome]
MGLVQHALLFAAVVAEVVEGQRARAIVDIGEGIFQLAVGDDRQQGAEDLLLHQFHLVRGAQHQGMGQAPALGFGEQRQQACALGLGVGQVAVQAAQLALVDDGGVVGVVLELRVEALHGLAIGLDEALDAVFRHQHVVRRHAGLAGIHGLAEGDALGGVGQRHVGGDDGWRFAAQLQGYRGQVLGRRAHHVLADAGGAGEQQVVEGLAGEGHAHFGLAQHHAYQVFGEDARQQVLEQLRGGRGGLAHLDHHPIAGGQGAHQRADGQVQRIVPGHYDPDHAQRLVDHLGRSRLEGHADAAARGFHPLLQALGGVVDAVQAGHDLGQQGLVGRAVAEVPGDGGDQGVLLGEQQLAEGVQPLDALVGAGHGVGAKSLALALEERLQLADLLLGLLQVGDVGDHGAVPRRLRESRPNPLGGRGELCCCGVAGFLEQML